MATTAVIGARVQKALIAGLDKLAADCGKSRSEVLESIISNHLNFDAKRRSRSIAFGLINEKMEVAIGALRDCARLVRDLHMEISDVYPKALIVDLFRDPEFSKPNTGLTDRYKFASHNLLMDLTEILESLIAIGALKEKHK